MAPVPGLSRQRVLAMLDAHDDAPAMRIDMGSPHRDCAIIFDGQTWRLCPMVVDPGEVERERERRLAAGLSFMPEHVVDLQRPGEPLIERADLAAFREVIATIPWKMGGPDLGALSA